MIKQLTLLLALATQLLPAQGQVVDSAYLNYLDQYSYFAKTRVLDGRKVGNIVDSFRRNQLVSNDRFAELTRGLYSREDGTAILLFFYYHDTLRRALFEPGRLVDEQRIAIKKERMLELGSELEAALHIPGLSANRAPAPRGIRPPTTDRQPRPLAAVLQDLSTVLLPKAFDKRYRHLIVIPALNIGSMPFHLLQPYDDGSYLVDHCSYTVAPTLIDFIGLRGKVLETLGSGLIALTDFDEAVHEQKIHSPKKVHFTIDRSVLVGNPAYPVDSPFVFPDLPGAAREVDSALAYLPGATVFRGRAAEKGPVLDAMNGADLAYFATHSVSSSAFSFDDSYLVLSGRDPYLHTWEIMSLRLKDYRAPQMVILSACQTGLGAAVEAGVAGSVARGFIIGGSNHVLMSLWNVDDGATAYLMNRYLYYLTRAGSFQPSEHLRAAVLDSKKRYPDPVYWAGFSFFGVDY